MRAGLLLVAVAAAGSSTACTDPCCSYDSRPIRLERAKQGELLVRVSIDGEGPRQALLDTGTPITIWNAPLTGSPPQVKRRNIQLLGLTAPPAPVTPADAGAPAEPGDGGDDGPAPADAAPATAAAPATGATTRAILNRTQTVAAPLAALPGESGPIAPVALLGGDLLSSFSVEIGFAAPELVLWTEQQATDSFLSSAGYAVLHVQRRGGGELESKNPEGFGPDGPFQYPASLLVLRACGAPGGFTREQPLVARCCGDDQRTLATGTDLSLVLGTGYGPVILSRSAWNRVIAGFATPPVMASAPLVVATSEAPLAAQWSLLPRLALVDREADPAVDPGPCVELGRARRLEQVALAQSRNADHAVCALPCDQDPRTEHRAQNSAGYLELAGAIPVAVIDDGERLLQTLRAEVHPGAPEIDGIIGADALRAARVELDYKTQPSRAIFSCEASAPAADCRAVGRCPRLPEPGQTHTCFGLPAHALPRICDNPTACD